MSRVFTSDEIWNTIVRISLASIWLYAGVIGKLLNPGFLNPNSNQYVGLTIQYFSQGSIIRGFLYAVAFPHPILTGILVMIGEISFGISLLLGLGVKLSSTTAFYTNLIYFLSASWTGAEEYGLNLLMMILDVYFIIYGGSKYCLDNFLPKSIVNNTKICLITGSVIYLGVVIFLFLYGL
ncbi:TQO small subunit DoxD [Saccharolobus sp. A20]|uniref:TQO small subunit DoxD n=2 Tax=Sulfolobaceae TaxID=118883 RepID=UPI0008460295|nr:TQO small subunit DoxD [Sulfolobus sp. A20]